MTKVRIAIVGVGSTGFSRTNQRSSLALALDASTQAIRDAALTGADVDGVVAIGEPGAPGPQALAAGLRQAGVAPGEVVGLLAPSQPEWVLALLAIVRAGAIAMPVSEPKKRSVPPASTTPAP